MAEAIEKLLDTFNTLTSDSPTTIAWTTTNNVQQLLFALMNANSTYVISRDQALSNSSANVNVYISHLGKCGNRIKMTKNMCHVTNPDGNTLIKMYINLKGGGELNVGPPVISAR